MQSESRKIFKAMSKPCRTQQRNDKTDKKKKTNGYATWLSTPKIADCDLVTG
jgi:hypothetical protein